MDVGLLIIRTVIGLLIAAHGTRKLFGWFGGNGFRHTARWFGSIGFTPGPIMAAIAGTTEMISGLMFAFGLATPLAAAGITGTLVVAMYTHRASGLWSANGGFELPLLYTTSAVGVGLTGAGQFSLDNALPVPHTAEADTAAVLIVGSILLATAVILRTRFSKTHEGAS